MHSYAKPRQILISSPSIFATQLFRSALRLMVGFISLIMAPKTVELIGAGITLNWPVQTSGLARARRQ